MPSEEDIVFRPQYDPKYRFALLAFPLMLLVGTLLLFTPEADIWFGACLAFLIVVFVLRLPYNYLREIRFGEHITLKHAFLPKRTYSYADVRDVGMTGFRLRRATVQWSPMENAQDLIATLEGLIERGVIPEEQLEGKQAGREYSDLVAGAVGSLIGFVVLIGLKVFGVRPRDFMPADFFGLAVVLVCWGIVYLLHRTLVAE